MRLSTLFLVYAVSTAGAIATPFVIGGVEHVRRWTKPVNSEAPLEAVPPIYPATNSGDTTYARPACVASDGTEYYGNRGVFYAGGETGDIRYLYSDVSSSDFESCAVRADGTVYILAAHDREGWLRAYNPSGQLNWSVPLPRTFSHGAISKTGTTYISARPWNGTTVLTAYDTSGAAPISVNITIGIASAATPGLRQLCDDRFPIAEDVGQVVGWQNGVAQFS